MERVRSNIEEHLSVITTMMNPHTVNVLGKIAGEIIKSIKNGGKVLIAGNGGSAADAQHIAGEFVGRFLFDRPALPAIALSADSSVLTCVGNDYSFDDVFARQVESLAKSGDVFWAISTSGNSENILQAARAAKRAGAVIVGFTGEDGGKLKDLCDHIFQTPHHRSNRIQEGHVLAYHIVCELFEAGLCGNSDACD